MSIEKIVFWLQIVIPLTVELFVLLLCLLCSIGLDSLQERMA